MSNKEIISYLYKVSEAKHKLMKDLMLITKEQSKAIEENDIKAINSTITKKDKIIKNIDKLDKEFVEKYSKLKELLGISDLSEVESEPIDGFKELKSKIGDIVEDVEEINKLDMENTQKIQNNIKNVKTQLKDTRKGKHVVGNYNKRYKESQSIFIDKKN